MDAADQEMMMALARTLAGTCSSSVTHCATFYMRDAEQWSARVSAVRDLAVQVSKFAAALGDYRTAEMLSDAERELGKMQDRRRVRDGQD